MWRIPYTNRTRRGKKKVKEKNRDKREGKRDVDRRAATSRRTP